MNLRYRHFYLVWGVLENLFFSGILFGWGALIFILIDESIYGNLCANQTLPSLGHNITVVLPGIVDNYTNSKLSSVMDYALNDTDSGPHHVECPAQNKMLAIAITVGSTMWSFGVTVIGQVNYKFGIRIARTICMITFVCGSLMIAFTTAELPGLIFPGVILMGIGGLSLGVTNIQITNLYNRSKAKATTLLTGFIDSSAVILVFVKMAYQNGISKRNSFFFITAAHVMAAISTFVFFPTKAIAIKGATSYIDDKDDEGKKPKNGDVSASLIASPTTDKSVPPDTVAFDDTSFTTSAKAHMYSGDPGSVAVPSLWASFCSPLFLVHALWLCINQIRFYFIITSVHSWVSMVCKEDQEKVSYYLDVFSYTLLFGCVPAALSGVVLDWQKQRYKGDPSSTRRQLMPTVCSLSITSSLGVLLSVLVLIPYEEVLYLAFIVTAIFRANIYGISNSYLLQVFPVKYFSSMQGVVLGIAGVASLLQMPLFIWFQSSVASATHVQILLIFMVFLGYINPLYIAWTEGKCVCRRKQTTAL